MKKLAKRTLLVAAIVTPLAVAAAPANATITPSRVGQTFAGTSTNSNLTRGGLSVTCPTAEITGKQTSALGFMSVSYRITLSKSSIRECLLAGLFLVQVSRIGSLTVTEASSVSRTSITADVTLDTGFELSFDVPSQRCSITIRGRQGPFRGAATLDNAQRMRLDLRGIVGSGAPAGSRCDTPATAAFAATFNISTPRYTIS